MADTDDAETGTDTDDAGTGADDAGTGDDDADTELLVTVRDTAEGTLVAVCDPGCVGETYEDGRVSLTVSESFYAADADRLPVEAAMTTLAGADTANLVGEHSVEAAVEAGIVDADTVLDVDGTLHAQVVWL